MKIRVKNYGKFRVFWVRNNDEYLKLLSKLIAEAALRPELNELADNITAYSPYAKNIPYDATFPEKAFYYAQNLIKYHKQPRVAEKILSPELIAKKLKRGEPVFGDCDAKVYFLGALLVNRGFDVKLIGAEYRKDGKYLGKINHVYLEYYDPDFKAWVPLDPSGNRPFGSISPKIRKIKEYPVTPVEEAVSAMSREQLARVLTTTGEIIKSVGKEMEKPESLDWKIKLISWITHPYTKILLATNGALLGIFLIKGFITSLKTGSSPVRSEEV